jgi:hypothetical protein
MTATTERQTSIDKKAKTFKVTHSWTYDLAEAEKIRLDLIKQQSELRVAQDKIEDELKAMESHAREFEVLKRGGTNKWNIQQWLQMLTIVQSAAGKAQKEDALKNHKDAVARLDKDIKEIESFQKELGE